MEKSKYNPTIGYLKALGIALMVLCHACSDKMPGSTRRAGIFLTLKSRRKPSLQPC